MTRTMAGICSALLIAAVMPVANAEPNKALYDLQERCGKRSAEVWKLQKDPGPQKMDGGTVFTGYDNHFSAALNRCFIRYTTTFLAVNHRSFDSIQIDDANEGKTVASKLQNFNQDMTRGAVTNCFVEGKKCFSEEEFNQSTKAFTDN